MYVRRHRETDIRGYFRKIIWAAVAGQTFFYGIGGLGANALSTFSSLGLSKNRSILSQSQLLLNL